MRCRLRGHHIAIGMSRNERIAKKTAFAIINGEYPEKVDACRNLLAIISRRSGTPSLQNDPALQFAYLQIHLSTVEIISKFDKQNISHIEIRENCENLCQLFTLFLVDRSYICLKFANALLQLCMAVCEVCNLLEKKCQGKYVNWPLVGRNFVKQAKEADSRETTSFSAYIPKLKEFEQGSRIGAGNFSEVYIVTQKSSGHRFAMKISPRSKFSNVALTTVDGPSSGTEKPRMMKRNSIKSQTLTFVDRMFGALTHDHLVCRIFCTFQAEPDVDITLMEVGIHEVDVLRLVEHVGYLSTEDTLLVVLQAVLAIEHVHLRGFIHRDVRPSNFVIDGFGKFRLVDFDSAKVCRGHFGSDNVLTDFFKRTAREFKEKEFVGAVAYTAPEVLQKKGWGRASDWWSLGVSIYKMTTGRLPFRGGSPSAVIESVCKDDLRWPKAEESPHSASPEIKEFVYDLLKKNARRRLGSKIYSDLHEPTAMTVARGLLRKVQTFKGSGLTLRGKLCVIAFSEIDCNITRDLKTPVAQLLSESPNVGYYNLSDLCDRTEDATPLMSFSHPKYRRFIDRLSGDLPRSDEFLIPITPPPDRELNYLQRYDAETLIGFTMQETAAKREARIQLVNASFEFITMCFCSNIPNIKLRLVRGEGSLTYPVVYAKIETDAENNIDEVNYGDIVVSIEKFRVIGLSMDRVSAVMKQCMRTSGGVVGCQVLKNNVFRSAYAERSEAHRYVTRSTLTDVTLNSSKCKYLQTRFLKLWNPEAMEFEGFHVVSFVHPSVSPTMIFFGDVLVQLNGHDLSHVEPAEVERLYENRKTISVVFRGTSVLRRKDLHEAGVEAETDTADSDLERMILASYDE